MRRYPDVDLFKPLLQQLLCIPHFPPVQGSVLGIDADADQLVAEFGAAVGPSPADDYGIGAGCAEGVNQLVIRYNEFLALDPAAVVIEKREQNFEPDHLQL